MKITRAVQSAHMDADDSRAKIVEEKASVCIKSVAPSVEIVAVEAFVSMVLESTVAKTARGPLYVFTTEASTCVQNVWVIICEHVLMVKVSTAARIASVSEL